MGYPKKMTNKERKNRKRMNMNVKIKPTNNYEKQ